MLNLALEAYGCAGLPAQTRAKVFLFAGNQLFCSQTSQCTELPFRWVLPCCFPYAGELCAKTKYLSKGSLFS